MSGSVRIEPTPSGPTASVRTADGRWIRLHSGRDPVGEAERTVAALMAGGEPPLLICIGLGLGYLLDAVEQRSSTTRVLAFEPLPEVARAMLERRSWQEWTASGRLTLVIGPDYAGAAGASRCIGAHTSAPVVVSPVLEREFAPGVAEARKIVDQALFGARANDEARRAFAPGYVVNTLRNIPVIAASADVTALYNAFAGVPAIVVAAGPSLDRNIEALRHVRDRALIVAVDTALRPLLDAGITPEIVVSVDPSEVNGRHLRNLPDPAETWLVGEGSLEPAAFEPFAGRTFTFSVSDHHPWPWLRSMGLARGGLRAWGSVITSAFDLALRAGCDPIVFAGADLAYPEQRPYCRGTIYEQDWATRAAGGEALADIWRTVIEARATTMVHGVGGVEVATTSPLLAFRDWLVEQSTTSDRRIVNATGGGALVGGRIEQSTLSEALAAAPSSKSPGVAAMRAIWLRGRPASAPDRLAVTQALDAIAAAPADAEPVKSWLAFGSPDLTAEAVNDAIREAMHPPDRTAATVPIPSSSVDGLRYAPERVMAIRAAVTGHAIENNASAIQPRAGASHEAPAAALARASDRLMTILRTSGLLEKDPSADEARLPGCVPATRDFSWTAEALNLVLEYEIALAEMLACPDRPEDPGMRAALAHIQVSSSGELDSATDSEALAVDTTLDSDAAPRLALIADWLSVASRWDDARGDAVVIARGHSLPLGVAATVIRARVEALRAGLEGPSAERVLEMLTGALVRVPAGDGPVAVPPHRLPQLSMALPLARGALQSISIHVRSAPDPTVDPVGPRWLRAARVDQPCAWIPPLRLNHLEIGPCMMGNLQDEDHAQFTVVNGTHAVRVDATGRWEPDAPWPGPITGQMRWGGTGAIAWHNSECPRVMLRERPGGDVTVESMPFGGGRAFPQPDGSIRWTSARAGGLWSWTPGGTWRRLVETPPILGLQVSAEGVRLDARGDTLDFAVRNRIPHAFWWRPGSDTLETIELGAEGPCWSTASRGDWTASAYPHSDVILLRHADGRRRTLTCHYPFNIVWAGPSLVVSTGAGHLVVFRDLAGLMERL